MSRETGAARGGLLATPPPSVAIEIARDRVAAVSVGDGSDGVVISAYAFEPLAATVLEPGLNAANVHDEAALTAAVKSALDKTHGRVEEAARILGISRKGLFLKRRRWGLSMQHH